MAIGNTAQLAELINRVWDEPFAELISRDEFLLKRFPKVDGSGDGVRWHVMADQKNTTAASYAEGAAQPTAVAHKYLNAFLTWRYVWAWVQVSGQAIAQTRGEGGFRQALQNELQESMLDLRNQINNYLLANTATATDIDGVQTSVTNSGVYANIDPATYTEWAAYLNTTASALTIALMQDVKTKLEDMPRLGQVSVILTGATQWNNYGNLLTSLRRFTPEQTLDGGFQALDFEGVPVVKVRGYATGRMDFLSEKDQMGNANFVYRTLKNFDTQDKSQQVADGALFAVYHYANLQCRNRRINGALTALT